MLYLLLYQQIVYVKYMQSFHCQYFKTVIHYFLNTCITSKESCSHTFISYAHLVNFSDFFLTNINLDNKSLCGVLTIIIQLHTSVIDGVFISRTFFNMRYTYCL